MINIYIKRLNLKPVPLHRYHTPERLGLILHKDPEEVISLVKESTILHGVATPHPERKILIHPHTFGKYVYEKYAKALRKELRVLSSLIDYYETKD